MIDIWSSLATQDLTPPFAAVDLDAFDANADDLVRRAGGMPIRVASKSVRCRALLERALAKPGFRGILAYSLREALWLVDEGMTDIFVAYPTTDRAALLQVVDDEKAAREITVAIDSAEHLDFLDRCKGAHKLRVALDIDASLRLGAVHIGARRSPLRGAREARELASDAVRRGYRVVGIMFYDAQIAGVQDSSPAVRTMKVISNRELRRRRKRVIGAVRGVAPIEFVNAGGTGSLHLMRSDHRLTELAAGSGLYGPALFDGYTSFAPRHAAVFATPVLRRPAPGIVTVFAGGYIASGAVGKDRWPVPFHPAGLSLLGMEGAGEVQTPLEGEAADTLAIGDLVWFRHAKAGELLERFNEVNLVQGGRVVKSVPSYRGEGKNFG